MAYRVRYRAEWRATTRGERNYIVDILEDNYTGNISPMYLTGECATITYGETDESELKPIKSSEAVLSILCTEDGDPYMKLFTLKPKQYQVVIYQDGEVIWRGYVATGDYRQPLSKPPYVISIRANDGLGALKAMPYLDADGNKFTTKESVSSLIRRLLAPITDNVEIWGYNLLYADQSSSTFDIVSISDSAIYYAFGDDTPTYYDVLENVLANFGVQLFQNKGMWYVRSLAMLANASNSNLLKAVVLDTASRDGLGVKADSVVSFTPPIRKLAIPDSASNASMDVSSIVSEKGNWVTSTGYAPYRPVVSKYGDAIKVGARGYRNLSSVIYGCATLLFQPIIHRSQSIKLSLSADIYANSTKEDTVYYIGLWIVGASGGEVVKWTEDIGYSDSQISFPRPTYYWNAEKEQWVGLKTISNPTYSNMGMQKTTIPKVSTLLSRPALSSLPNVSVTCELPSIPTMLDKSGYNEQWQIALVVATSGTVGNAISNNNKEIYIANPRIVIDSLDSYNTTESLDISISPDGITDESYHPKWRTATSIPKGVEFFDINLVDLSNGDSPVYGYMEACDGIADRDVVGKMISALRSTPTRAIEGEVDKALPDGLNTIAKIGDRYYYLPYMRQLLKRGISSIQLRELPQLTEKTGVFSIPIAQIPKGAIIGLDRSMYWLTSSKLYWRDQVANTVSEIRAVAGDAVISRGVRCVTVAEKYSSTSSLVEAYDDYGKSIAKVVDFSDDDITIDNWINSARYDAISNVWLAHNFDKKVVMCDQEGYVIGRWECAIPTNSDTITEAEVLPYNGGFIYRIYSSYQGGGGVNYEPSYYSFWHSYAIHQAGEFEPIGTYPYGYKNVKFVNERFIVCYESNKYIVYHRRMVDMGLSGPLKRYTIASDYEVVDINNGIILTRGTGGIAVYDTRATVSSKYYIITIGSPTSSAVLCGDVVYASSAIANQYQWLRILPKLNSVNSISIADE